MKYDIDVNQKYGQVVICTHGNLDTESEKSMFAEIIAHPECLTRFNLLFDHSHCRWGHLSNDEIRNRAQSIVNFSHYFDDGKIAIVLSTDLDFGLGRMLEAYTAEHLHGHMKIFRNRNQAESWLS